ncbi:ABC-type transport system involved in cytochrome bd biosynthesis [Commensalibacter communis]|uniref:thiol reductant ABC exporter subunit CydC n=1 Tax=Commensalibacter communis TaxID=2972786 RepID=UPI0022FF8F82|nr:thiol reductant ABC exporter subunit CydC [Commensalibacter communis]CAI3948547.1 ABC-type transport system involved in cytochrome bd biosynthesis [Commensalibacter communis]CAI3949897.1 ABC-type transport system involved in cytochrome bd biosynthesis [Commensalibacter communis]
MSDIQDPLRQQETPKAAFQQIFIVWKPHIASLTIGIIFSLIALALGLTLMSSAGGKIAFAAMGMLVISSVFLKLLGGGRLLMRYVERLYTHNVMFKAIADLRVWFFAKLSKGAAAGLGFRHSGDVLSRLVSDIETLDGLYLRLMLPFAGSILTFLVIVFVIGSVHLLLALCIAFLYILAGFVCPLVSALMTKKHGQTILNSVAQLRIGVLDFIQGLREIRAFGAEDRITALLDAREKKLFEKQFKQAKVIALMSFLSFISSQVAVLLILAAALDIGFHGIGAAHIVVCLFLTITAFEVVVPLTKAGGLAGQIINAATRVVGVNKGHGYDVPKGSEEAPEQTDIELNDIGFQWNKDRPFVYRHLNLKISQGERVAIIGPSGAGKSTLAALLLKVIAPQEGKITLGSKDLAVLTEESVRKKIAWLSQNTHLFDDTIRQNLLLSCPQATDDELWQALSEAAVADVVKAMPDGLDTWLGEGGIKVSGGQGRRIALARTLLSKAPILLLDEPTTGLDADTEMEFFKILNQISTDRTIILIAHRLTGTEKLDKVWRLSDSCLICEN